MARDGDSSDENLPMGEIGDDEEKKKSESVVKTVDSVGFPSLDDAINEPFDLNNITNMAQRLRNLNCQPRETKHLYPAPFLLLAKRDKRCKECNKIIIKPNMDPKSNEKMKADFQLLYYMPKVMIYRIGKYTPYLGRDQEFEMLLKIINNDDSVVKISFSKLGIDDKPTHII